jgi:hypothetical protein
LSVIPSIGPANGTVELNTDGSFTYTPNTDFTGVDTFLYLAFDGTNVSTEVTVSVSVGITPNTPPVANDDTYSTPFNTTLVVAAPGVLGNDTDADGDALTDLEVVEGPRHGVMALFPDGSLEYLPNPGFQAAILSCIPSAMVKTSRTLPLSASRWKQQRIHPLWPMTMPTARMKIHR